jgi:hypothetical protein
MSKPHVYKLKYDFNADAGQYSKEEIKEAGKGGSDALLLVSVLYPENGSLSIYFESMDGRNEGKSLSDHEVFKIWLMLAGRLGRSTTLNDIQREYADFTMKHYMDKLRDEVEPPEPDDAA